MKIIAKPIKMVCVFDEKGTPTPVRFKVEEEDGVWHLIKVERINCVRPVRPAGMDALVYHCQSEIRGVLKPYEIIYHINFLQLSLCVLFCDALTFTL